MYCASTSSGALGGINGCNINRGAYNDSYRYKGLRDGVLTMAERHVRGSSPLESLPPKLASKFRRAHSIKLKRSIRSPQSTSDRSASPSAPTPDSNSFLSNVWRNSSSKQASEGSGAVEKADNGLKSELKRRALTLLDGDSSDPNTQTSTPKSYLESLRDTHIVEAAPDSAATSKMSKRTEDEQIRANRQQRLADQGLDGLGNTGWRKGDSSEDTGVLHEAESFSQLLSPRVDVDAAGQQDLSAEQFTLRKEATARKRGAAVISADSAYKPKVGTWGIYERPRDISKAFGGGRKLTPADTSTSAEEQAEFDAALKAQLLKFRQTAGLDVDPAVEVECKDLTEKGKILLQRGNLDGALTLFDEASSLLHPKTNAGGAALLQKAIALDSLGKSGEALKLYRQLKGHRCLEVAKTAKVMSFGFKAGEFLKADKFSYAAKKEELDPYFSVLGGKWGWNTVYVATEEEKLADKKNNTVLAFAAVLMGIAPLGILYILYSYQC